MKPVSSGRKPQRLLRKSRSGKQFKQCRPCQNWLIDTSLWFSGLLSDLLETWKHWLKLKGNLETTTKP